MDGTERFIKAQSPIYTRVVRELEAGKKKTHWMWYIFPQLRGIGESRNSVYYGIADLEEAKAYLAHPVLGTRLKECASLLLCHTDKTAEEIMGVIDDLKLQSSMTLFALTDEDNSVFRRVLDVFFEGETDKKTEELLGIKRR